MSNVSLPSRFEEKLKSDQKLSGFVYTVLGTFGEILSAENLYFFEEYTDHGITHIEKVLHSSDHLIPRETSDTIITAKDAGYYILTVILHDIGMHLLPEGFLRLINGEYDAVQNKDLDPKTWNELWNDYLDEARKFNEKQLLDIFGDKDFLVTPPKLPTLDNLTGSDRKLIGEFVRRHHPRLAHEIALMGMPGKEILPFAKDLPDKDRDLIGLIARSHGLGLRKSADYVPQRFGKSMAVAPLGVHAVYLMTIIRLADYIQIDKDRTSDVLLGLRTLSSLLSKKEHAAHLAIDHVDHDFQNDPEKIFVTASPVDSEMFFKLKKLFESIQYEFDQSWAVLGELYGNNPKKPGIRFRRISSNFDDPEFVKGLPYVADTFNIHANEELIKLLIAPLYGDDPTFGIRELLQNAIDACRERSAVESPDAGYQPEIKIHIQQRPDEIVFVISDNGTGMDTDTIKHYFLKAGASFRNSSSWRKLYEKENGDFKVRRSGRFGIGALAAFLIGKRIAVKTRKINEPFGYEFETEIDTAQIDVKKAGYLPFGTSITITLTKDVFMRLLPNQKVKSNAVRWYEWFTLDSPAISYSFNTLQFEIDTPNSGFDDDLPANWQVIDSPGYDRILWTYSNKVNPAKMTCNGIVIPQDPGTNGLRFGLLPHLPKISVFDSAGTLPLTLNRNGYAARFTFTDDLQKDVYKDFIAFLLTVRIRSKISDNSVHLVKQRFNYPGLLNKFTHDGFSYGSLAYSNTAMLAMLSYPLLGKKGFLLDYSQTVRKLRPSGLLIQTNEKDITIENFDIKKHFIKFSAYSLSINTDFKSVIEPKHSSQSIAPAAFFIKEDAYENLFDVNVRRLSISLKKSTHEFYRKHGWVGFNIQLGRETIISENLLENYGDQINLLRDYFIKPSTPGDPMFNELLDRYLGENPVIPYDLEARKALYPKAFEELEPYMQKYS